MDENPDNLRRLKEALAERPMSLSKVVKIATEGMSDEDACKVYEAVNNPEMLRPEHMTRILPLEP